MPVPIVFFDLDGTLTVPEMHGYLYIINALDNGPHPGVAARVAAVDERYYAGEIQEYQDWATESVRQLHGASRTQMYDACEGCENYLVPNIEKGLRTIKKTLNCKLVMLSGSLEPFAHCLSAVLRDEEGKPLFDDVLVSELLYDENKVLCGYNVTWLEKDEEIRRYCSCLGVDPRTCVFVGDGTNDIAAFSAVGAGVAVSNAKDVLKEQAAVVAGPGGEGVAEAVIEAARMIEQGKVKIVQHVKSNVYRQ